MEAQIKPYGQDEIEFYGDALEEMRRSMKRVINCVTKLRASCVKEEDRDPVEHVKARIKSAESMRAKLKKRGLPVNRDTALSELTDSVGIRVVCTFVSDVYLFAGMLEAREEFEVVDRKDYIETPKENGYRSYHLILRMKDTGYYVEVQLRTIAMDCWASLEHQLKYKKNINHQKLLVNELKRCADEIASTDLSLETIRGMIGKEE